MNNYNYDDIHICDIITVVFLNSNVISAILRVNPKDHFVERQVPETSVLIM